MENIKDSTPMRDQSTSEFQIAMANSRDPPNGSICRSEIDIGLKVAETSNKTVKSHQAATNVESKKRDVFGSFCHDARHLYGNLKSSVIDLEEKAGKRCKAQAFNGENIQKIWKYSGPKDDVKKKYNMFPSSFDEVETRRVCTTVVDSVVGLSGGKHSRYSQTTQSTQSLLIKKNTESNLFRDDQIYLYSGGGTRYPFGSPLFDHHVPNLHPNPPHKSTKGKMVLSSAETENIHAHAHAHGVNSSPLPVKVINLGFSTAPRLVSVRGEEEDRLGLHKMKLPDMNLEAPTSSADAQTLEYQEPITSRTQSLDKETVLSHAEHVNTLESVNDLLAGGGWLKRLKLNDSDSHSIGGKKRSDCVENSRHERGNSSLKRFLESSLALASKNHGKELMVVDEATTLQTRGDSSDIVTAKKDRELLLSKSWVRRWCRHEETPKKISNAEIDGGEPSNSNLLVEGRNKQQFPSIGAMALMAKTMNCLETYDIRNRGAVMVWNTKGF